MIANSAHNNSTSLQYTASYVWSTADVLGQGATGSVFKGRDRKSGKEYAIKVFNTLSFMTRPADVRRREFEVLRKVDHQNIVRLYDVEEEVTNYTAFQLSSKHEVIIMELCSAGNLYTMVNDDPEYLYGLDEDEFKRVLSHITSGMKHLHDREIVHRDLKPGNIMRSYGEDGASVYKLTDFGAARELSDNEQFHSLYGTEEYLHPDIYERAVLRKPQGKKFSATVDLWSLGVTLYHVATGMLPFRPYGGARRNKEVMHKITTEKPSGVISGTQQTEMGVIEWSRDLPKTCRLSQSFKQLFTPVLSGILECDPHKIWTFDRYFSEVDEILSKKVIDVFAVPSAVLHKVYISPEKTLISFQEHVAELSDIRSSRQLLLHEGAQFEIEAFKPVKDYPNTTPGCPIIVLSMDMSDFQGISIPHTCEYTYDPTLGKPPKVKPSHVMGNDSSLAKVCSSTLFDIKKSVKYLLMVQELIRLAVKWFVLYLKSRVVRIQLLRSELQSRLDCLKSSLEIFEEHYQRETSLLRVISVLLTPPPEVNELKLYFTQITDKAKTLRQIRTDFELINKQIKKLDQVVIQDETPASVFVDEGSRREDKLYELMNVKCDGSREIYLSILKQKHKKLSEADEQIRKFVKQRLKEMCEASVKIFTEKSVPPCKRLHKSSRAWFSDMNEYLKQVHQSDSGISMLSQTCIAQEDSVRSLQRIYRDKLSLVEAVLKESATRPQSATSVNLSPTYLENCTNNHTSLPQQTEDDHKRNHQKQYVELKKGLIDARNSLKEVKTEVETSSELLRRLGSFNTCGSQ